MRIVRVEKWSPVYPWSPGRLKIKTFPKDCPLEKEKK